VDAVHALRDDRQQGRSGIGERDLPGVAVEEAKPELALELAHQQAQPRRRDEHPFGRAREVAELRDELERLQLPGREDQRVST
jgi:hypothetical protein